MISQKYKFIFIHVPKTAGNSIHDTLRDYIDDKLILKSQMQDGVERFGLKNTSYPSLNKHSRLSEYYKYLGDSICDYKIYTTIRNPFDKLISYYFSPHRWHQTTNKQPKWDYHKIELILNQMPELRWFINTPALMDNIKFLKYETINGDFNKMCEEVGLPKLNLSHRNKSTNRSDYRIYYNNRLIDLIYNKHKFEISIGNYQY